MAAKESKLGELHEFLAEQFPGWSDVPNSGELPRVL